MEEVIGNDYNDDDLNEDNLLDALRDEAEPHAPYSEEIESLEGSDEEEEGELPPGVPDIPGLTVDHGVLKYKGEKVTSITGMDGKDKGEKVFKDNKDDDKYRHPYRRYDDKLVISFPISSIPLDFLYNKLYKTITSSGR